jgi:hypothetical protein
MLLMVYSLVHSASNDEVLKRATNRWVRFFLLSQRRGSDVGVVNDLFPPRFTL